MIFGRYNDGELVALVNASFDGGAPAASQVLLAGAAPGWYRVRITTGGTADATRISMLLASSAPNVTRTFMATLPPGADHVELRCGMVYAAPEADAATMESTHVDNVALKRCPPRP